MIRNSKQNWTVGSTVKVGFLTLVVKAAIATPGDGLPDVYFLANVAGTKLYEFTPHVGLRSVTVEEAAERVATFRFELERIADTEVSRAVKASQASARFNELFAVANGAERLT
jgi:hypothetical protein